MDHSCACWSASKLPTARTWLSISNPYTTIENGQLRFGLENTRHAYRGFESVLDSDSETFLPPLHCFETTCLKPSSARQQKVPQGDLTNDHLVTMCCQMSAATCVDPSRLMRNSKDSPLQLV